MTTRALAILAACAFLAACAGAGSTATPFAPGVGNPVVTTPAIGAVTIGAPSFGASGGSGACSTGIIFTAIGQTATLPLTQSGYSGAFTVTDTNPNVASASIAGSTLTLTALAGGTTFITVAGGGAKTAGCNVGVVLPNASPTPGAPVLGPPTFPNGGTGSCAAGSALSFTAAGQYATIALTEANYSGEFTAVSDTPSVASASITGSTLTVTANAAGNATVTVSDSAHDSTACAVGVTTSAGTVEWHGRR